MQGDLSDYRFSVSILRSLLIWLERNGYALNEVLLGTNIPPASLEDQEARITLAQMRALLWRACELANDPALPFKCTRTTQIQALGLIGYVLSNASTLGHMFELLGRYRSLLSDTATEYLQPDGDSVCVYVTDFEDNTAPPAMDRPLVEYQLNTLQRIITGLGAPDQDEALRPIEAHFRHPQPPHLALYQEVFGPKLRFNQPLNFLRYPRAAFSQPMPFANPQMLQRFLRDAHATEQRYAQEDFTGDIKREIRRRLHGHAPAVNDIADHVHMSRSTLHRRLQEAGSSFKELLDETRRDIARELVESSGNSITDIAFTLGYASTSAFNHAFKRWEGQSPNEYRRQLLSQAAGPDATDR